MIQHPINSSRRVLDTYDRASEVLFGLIMVLTFTGSLSIAVAGRDDIRTMLIGALGCNLVWGLIDGFLHLMGCLAERGRSLRTLHAVRAATDAQKAQRILAGALPSSIAEILQPQEFEAMHQRISQMPVPPERARLTRQDYLGSVAVFLLVFLSTFPVIIPFLVMHHGMPALRISNAVAIALLFVTGFAYGKCIKRHPWAVGVIMVFVGLAFVALTIALGG